MSQDDADDPRLIDALAEVRRLASRSRSTTSSVCPATLLAQLAQMRAGIHVADWSERMKRAGMELIATKVEEESKVLALMELNVTLAQDFLLGEPRPLREAV